MEFYIYSTTFGSEDESNRLLEEYPELLKYNPLIKEYENIYCEQIFIKKGIFIEVNSLEELVELSNEVCTSLIINDTYFVYDMNHKQINTIEIYDDWRE